MAPVLLIWMFTTFYAMSESGRYLMKHQKLSTIGALIGQTPVTAGTAPGAGVDPGGVGPAIVAYAHAQLGKPYVFGTPTSWAGEHPTFDCSGLTGSAVYAATNGGLNLPHNAALQMAALSKYRAGKDPAKWEPGDLIFYFIPGETGQGEPAHCAVWIGGGKVIAAPHTGDVVKVEGYQLGTIMGVRRPAAWTAGVKKTAQTNAAAGANT